ncbi:hypothetical protein [Roseateles amylovorans]|uniref:Uncharacterized protein n=1 Tax=Roseateles amylovorans TaxID=2978473 RepID=A0ABY6B586_9BURK|nr:hypothetical protein [Roseateles amylovorans]UXH80334.1 hypothetical protein N4261_10845 [Roseateles amylovorans]
MKSHPVTEELATVVFKRTRLADAKLRHDTASVPAHLRTLLLAIDGRLTVERYVAFLNSLAPLSPKFVQLEALGLVQRTRPPSESTLGAPPPLSKVEATLCDVKTLPLRGRGLDPNIVAAIESVFSVDQGRSSVPVGPPAEKLNAGAARQADDHLDCEETLNLVKKEMSRFISETMELKSMPLSQSIQMITTTRQLLDELPDYAQLLAPLGEAAARHIDQLHQLLQKNKRPLKPS